MIGNPPKNFAPLMLVNQSQMSNEVFLTLYTLREKLSTRELGYKGLVLVKASLRVKFPGKRKPQPKCLKRFPTKK